MTKIIAFAGRKQSGKTTCAQAVKDLFTTKTADEDYVQIYNFADPLKRDICMNLLGLTYDQCYGSDDHKNELTNNFWNNKQLTAREVMQFVGTDIFRTMQNNIWADATLKKIKYDDPDIAVIADCRFPNEVQAVKDAGGYVIKLTRDPFNSDHASETALDPKNFHPKNFDIVIFNHNLSIGQQIIAVFEFLNSKGLLKL